MNLLNFKAGATKKKRAPSKKSTSGNRKTITLSIPHWRSLVVGLVIGIFITIGILPTIPDLNFKIANPFKSLAFSKNKPVVEPPKQEKPSQKVAKKSEKPIFDFYTELTKTEEQNSHKNKTEHRSQSRAKQSKTLDLKSTKSPISQYAVQAGSFKRRSDADELKAQLTLNGFEAHIELARLGRKNQIWHRVMIGPFNSEQKAVEQQKKLQTLKISGTLVLKQTD